MTKQNDNHKKLCDTAKEIQDLLLKNKFEIKEGPNIGNVPCLWLTENNLPYYEGVYISKISSNLE